MDFSNMFKGIGDFFSVGSPVTSMSDMGSNDVIKTQNALADLGHFNTQVPDVGEGLKNFQVENGLKVDGIMNPGGETENALGQALSNQGLAAMGMLEKAGDALPGNATVSKPDSSKPNSRSWTASASFNEAPATPKATPKPKMNPMTGLEDPLAKPPVPKKSKAQMDKLWEQVAENQKPKTAILPQGDTVQQRIQSMMTDKRYGNKNDNRLRDHVTKQFERAYLGTVEYDETGKMIQPKAAIQPEEVEAFDPDGELSGGYGDEVMYGSAGDDDLSGDTTQSQSAQEWDNENPERIWVRDKETPKAPSRKKALLEGGDADFKLKPNENVDGKPPIYEVEYFEEVSKYAPIIDQKAEEVGIDPNVLRSIIYMESTHGYYDRIPGAFDLNRSIRPMNVYASYWKDLGYSRKDLKDPTKNIEAGAKIVKMLSEKMPDASISELATMYNDLNAGQVSEYGAQVERIFKDQPWAKRK